MTWSVAHTMPASTAAERLAAWVYIRDTFFATVLGGWTVTNYIDTATDPDRFSLSTDVVDLVSGNTRTNHYWLTNTDHASNDFTRFEYSIASYTTASSSVTDNINGHTVFSKSSSAANLVLADPSHAGFKFMVSDENNKAFLITLNNRLFMFHLGIKEIYGWADDDAWWTGAATGYRNFPVEGFIYQQLGWPVVFGGNNTTISLNSNMVPGIYYNQMSYYVKDHAYSRFPMLQSSSVETDDDITTLLGFSTVTDVSWVRPANMPTSGTQYRYWMPDNEDPYNVARQLNGNYVLFFKDATQASTSYALLDFGANDPS